MSDIDNLTEFKCDICNGKGKIISKTFVGNMRCPKCNGDGKLDWIENIVGKNKTSDHMRPGVFTKEIDLSERIPSYSYLKNKVGIDYSKILYKTSKNI